MKTLKPRIQLQQGKIGAHTTAAIRTRGNAWMAIRSRIMVRAKGLCEHCTKAGRIRPASEIDHITPLAQGGKDNDANLQALCVECHQAKSKAEQGA